MQKVRQFLSTLSIHGGILYSQKGWFLIIYSVMIGKYTVLSTTNLVTGFGKKDIVT